jgi:hypothetical protein
MSLFAITCPTRYPNAPDTRHPNLPRAVESSGTKPTVPYREWLENEGGVISSLIQQAIPAFERRWRSRHDEDYHDALPGAV